MRKAIIITMCFFSLCSLGNAPKKTNKYEINQFELAVDLIKKHEGWHNTREYIGYGHRITKKDKFKLPITKRQGDSILRADLRQKISCFSMFGKDSLILGVLAYNVGEGVLLGSESRSRSTLIKKIEAGNFSVYHEYVSFHKWNGKAIPSIKQRRITELNTLNHGFKRRSNESVTRNERKR